MIRGKKLLQLCNTKVMLKCINARRKPVYGGSPYYHNALNHNYMLTGG